MPDLTALRKFVKTDDRDGTPIFAGREREIAAIEEDLRDRLEGWEGGDLDAFGIATRLIQGAPGAGKTATLKHLEKTLPEAFKELRTCWLDSEYLGHPEHWQDELARAFDPKSP